MMHTASKWLLAALLSACLMSPAGADRQIEEPIVLPVHSFTSRPSVRPEGSRPYAALTLAEDGAFYGTTVFGGARNEGTVFKILPDGTLATLTSFTGINDGGAPQGRLAQGSDGAFYGTTFAGGNTEAGTIFRITADGARTTLHLFSHLTWNGAAFINRDGAHPYAGLIAGTDGNLYGTTRDGGTNGCGTVFKITPQGTLTTLHAFTYEEGAEPCAPLLQAKDGDFYGATCAGGDNGVGTLFKLTAAGALTTFHAFQAGSEGYAPTAALIQTRDGAFYGTTSRGGAGGGGTIFKMTAAGDLTPLYAFSRLIDGKNPDGSRPTASLFQALDDNLYGTTSAGGPNGLGTLFRINPDGSLAVLYAFTGGPEGGRPLAELVEGRDGGLYGTTSAGGTRGHGTIYALHPGEIAMNVTGLQPDTVLAGEPAFTLTIRGSGFVSWAIAHWSLGADTTELPTTYISPTEMRAQVPAALISSSGTAHVRLVVHGLGGGTSAAGTFKILGTRVKVDSVTLSRDPATGVLTANLVLKNTGRQPASDVSLTGSTLGTAATATKLPIPVETIAAGGVARIALSYPGTAGARGKIVAIDVFGTYAGGDFRNRLTVTLP